MRLNYIIVSLCFSCFLIKGQDKKQSKAQLNFEEYAFMDAIEAYELLEEKGYQSKDMYQNLGDAYYLNGYYIEASMWYKKLFLLDFSDVDQDYFWRYALTLKTLGNYEESYKWMQEYQKIKNKGRISNFFYDTNYLQTIEKNSNSYVLKKTSLNSTASDFAPSYFMEKLVFASARDSGLVRKVIQKWNNNYFHDLYVTAADSLKNNFDTPSPFSKILNQITEETTTAFNKDGTIVYFTRSNSENGKFQRDSRGISRLKIYKSEFKEGEWSIPKALPFTNDDYSFAHPSLSPTEDKLYFASDMPGSMGGSDIYVVSIEKDGTYGMPENLGKTINTNGRETFPFIANDNTLYFASDGHQGLGGLDIFSVNLKEARAPINIGKPINSRYDDFSFILNAELNSGYFSSNRPGGLGGDDIYAFARELPQPIEKK